MKTLQSILLTATLLLVLQSSFAQELESIMETTWRGGMRIHDSNLNGGYFVCTIIIYDLNMIGETTFTATATRRITIDGKEYYCQSDITGKLNTSNYSINSTPKKKYLNCQELPYDIDWHIATESLTLYEDEGNPGYYIMYGKSAGQIYDDEYVEYSNRL